MKINILGIVIFLVVTSWSTMIPMGESTTQQTVLKEPAYAQLEEGEELCEGRIIDEGTETEVTQLSFFGHTKVGGIRRENNDSVTTLDLTNIRSLKIKEQAYSSKRYPTKDFALLQKTSHDGAVSDDLLVPRHIVICGIEKKTGDEKAWFLNTVDELVVEPVVKDGATEKVVTPKAKPSKSSEPEAVKVPESQPVPITSEKKVEEEKVAPAAVDVKTDEQGIKPIKVKEEYKDMEVKVVEKKTSDTEYKTVRQAVSDFAQSIVDVIKALFNFVRSIIW
jgi:hypothetical protein